MNRLELYGYVLLLGALVIASSMPIAFKLGSALPAATLLFYMSIVGTATSFSIMMVKGRAGYLRDMFKKRSLFLPVIIVGVLIFALEPLIFAYATHYVSADLVAVIFRTWPITLVLLAPFVIHERVTKWDMVGVTIGFLGLVITSIGGTSISLPLYALPFVALLLFASVAEGFSSALSKRYNYELTSSIFVYNVISLLVFTPLAFYTNSFQLATITPSVIFSIFFLGVLTEAVFAYMFYQSLRLVKTAIAGTSFIVVAFITMLLSALFLGEQIEPYYIVIAATVAIGVLIQKLAPRSNGNFIQDKRGARYDVTLYDVTSAFVNTRHSLIAKTMKGNGRVIASVQKPSGIDMEFENELEGFGHEDLVIFTNRSNGIATPVELEFVRSMVGCGENDLIVFGSGDPAEIAERFAQIKLMLERKDTIPQPIR